MAEEGDQDRVAAHLRRALEKLAYLRGAGIDGWDLTVLTPNRRQLLAQLGRKSTNQALQRTPEVRRYPILIAFLRHRP